MGLVSRLREEIGLRLDVLWTSMSSYDEYRGISEDMLEKATLLGQPPRSEVEEIVKREFLRRQQLVSAEDIIDIAEFVSGEISVEYYAKNLSEPTINRRCYDATVDYFINWTHIWIALKPGENLVIGRIAVNPKYRNQRAGRMMYEAAEQIGREFGVKSVTLLNPVTSHGFWKKMGFTAEMPNAWRKGL